MKPLYPTLLSALVLSATCASFAGAQDVIFNSTKKTIWVNVMDVTVLKGTFTLTVQPPPGATLGEVRQAWAPPPEEGKEQGPDPYTLFTGIYDQTTKFKRLNLSIPPGGALNLTTTRQEGAAGGLVIFQAAVMDAGSSRYLSTLTYQNVSHAGSRDLVLLKVESDDDDSPYFLTGKAQEWHLQKRPKTDSRCIIL